MLGWLGIWRGQKGASQASVRLDHQRPRRACYRNAEDPPGDWQNSSLAARAMTGDPDRPLLLATRMFQRLPFGFFEPVSGRTLTARMASLGFDCLRCPVAEYFHSQNQARLCVATFCELDVPLATQWELSSCARAGFVGISWSIQWPMQAAHNLFCAAFGWPTPPRRKSDGLLSNAGLSQFA